MARVAMFPQQLLTAPNHERLSYFVDKKINHFHLDLAYRRVCSALSKGFPSELIFLIGPTGVGKTTLCNKLVRELSSKYNSDVGHLPLVMIEAQSPSTGDFSWKTFYRAGLEFLEEPLIDEKLSPSTIRSLISQNHRAKTLQHKASEDELLRALQSALFHRAPRVLIVDEAQHLRKIRSGKKLIDQVDTLKSIANKSGVKHLLVGTYEIATFNELSGQLNRRSNQIHLARYRYDIGEELEEFISALVNLELSLPVENIPCLSKYIDYVYEKTAGCVGILKDWLTKSLILAIENNDTSVTLDHLKETVLSNRKIERIAREIYEGESQLTDHGVQEIRSLLGMKKMQEKTSIKMKHTPPKKYPGRRVPNRDTVG